MFLPLYSHIPAILSKPLLGSISSQPAREGHEVIGVGGLSQISWKWVSLVHCAIIGTARAHEGCKVISQNAMGQDRAGVGRTRGLQSKGAVRCWKAQFALHTASGKVVYAVPSSPGVCTYLPGPVTFWKAAPEVFKIWQAEDCGLQLCTTEHSSAGGKESVTPEPSAKSFPFRGGAGQGMWGPTASGVSVEPLEHPDLTLVLSRVWSCL